MADFSDVFPQRISVSGAPDGMDAFFLVNKVRETGDLIVHIAKNDSRALVLKKTINFIDPEIKVFDFPAWDCLPYDLVSPNKEISCLRISCLVELIQRSSQLSIVISTANSISQRVPERALIKKSFLIIKSGKSIERESLISKLVEIGYQKVSTVTNMGEFAVRGGILDVFSPNMEMPVRIDFFGNQVDRIRFFNPNSQVSEKLTKEITICPVAEFYMNKEYIKTFRHNYRSVLGVNGLNDPLYEAISANKTYLGFEHWGPLFYEKMDTIFDYVPKTAAVSADYQISEALKSRWEIINKHYLNRSDTNTINTKYSRTHVPLVPDRLYISPTEWSHLIEKRNVFVFSPMALPVGAQAINLNAVLGRNFSPERQRRTGELFKNLIIYLIERLKLGPTLIACYTERSRERLQNILSENGFKNFKKLNTYSELKVGQDIVGLAILQVDTGFSSDFVTIISEKDVLGERYVSSNLKKRKGKDFLKDISTLAIKELVVHVEHGVGRYTGLEKIETLGIVREYLALEYSGNDKLLIPIENIELLSRYGQENAPLDKLGSSAWQNRKSRLKKRIFEMADSLIKIAANRKLSKCPVFAAPDFLWDDFCARFPYEETDDQLNAISDVLNDLHSGRPMDRLVCGDVGFGKTEVAMRAAFVVASAGKQVVVIVPTTLLCRQHFNNFQARFGGYPIKIEQLSRLVKAKDAAKVRDGIEQGSIDIVIGTHALLASKIKFSDIGLVIIDEEQHFGVVHKEKLKKIKSEVHVLTLTATPIPRTLQLALSGARELSIIASPPADRYTIRTYVSQFDGLTIKDALMREYFRGGQSFFIVPRISDIEGVITFLKENVSDLKVCAAHGKMSSIQLDKTMSEFYDRHYDILVATSIVESGLDIPSVNTLIVYKAEMFGLAQLYQIRGRIGRSKIRAYAYLITEQNRVLTASAEKRLKVLSNIDSLGAGFSLASHDLDIRGAGNLLGDEQSGQIKEVGYELYQQMLEEAVAKIRGGESREKEQEGLPIDDAWSPEINLNVPVLIPESFVPDIDLRLELYRKLSRIRNSVEMEVFSEELTDRFGKLPLEVIMLINIMKIKNKCFEAGIIKLDGGPRGATIKFFNDRFNNPKALLDYIHMKKEFVKVKNNQLTIKQNWKSIKSRITGAYAIVSDLAQSAKM